jgi:2-polyprenyl-6-methoxyphenol hydroxylase-like FAD-dependent oxidoreductase
MMLAAELALSRVDVAIVERHANRDLLGSRAGGLHSRTIEVFDQRWNLWARDTRCSSAACPISTWSRSDLAVARMHLRTQLLSGGDLVE